MTTHSFIIERFDENVVPYRTLLDVFHRSVHAIADAIYSAEQKSVWAPDCLDVSSWRQRLTGRHVWVALDDQNKECLGFIELDLKGDIECLFVCPRAQRLGIAKALLVTAYEDLMSHYPDKTYWSVQASDSAYDFFLKLGFLPIKRNATERFGITLENTTMEKPLL